MILIERGVSVTSMGSVGYKGSLRSKQWQSPPVTNATFLATAIAEVKTGGNRAWLDKDKRKKSLRRAS